MSVTRVRRKPGPPLSQMMHRCQPLPPFNCIHVWGLIPFSADLSCETWTKVCLPVSHNPKYVRGYYGESLVAYPLLLAAAEKVDEFVKLFLIMANAQQISIFHSENFKWQQDFPFFLWSFTSWVHCYPSLSVTGLEMLNYRTSTLKKSNIWSACTYRQIIYNGKRNFLAAQMM